MTCDQASLLDWRFSEGRHHVYAVLGLVLGHVGRPKKVFSEYIFL